MAAIKTKINIFLVLLVYWVVSFSVLLADDRCPGADSSPPPVLKADIPKISDALDSLQKVLGVPIWEDSDDYRQSLRNIFATFSQKNHLGDVEQRARGEDLLAGLFFRFGSPLSHQQGGRF